jgi:hypothetical protein
MRKVISKLCGTSLRSTVTTFVQAIEELYELFEALICCCKRAGIQVKASKTKFGVEKITFHNYTTTREGTQPKDANLCPIRNMVSLSDVSQVRAF